MQLNTDKMRNLIIIFIFIFGISNTVISQNNSDPQLASQYFANQEYDKAVVIYEKLYIETGYDHYLNYYVRCLFELKEYKKAEKFLETEIKKKSNYILKIYLGLVYYHQNRIKEANAKFDEVINQTKNNRSLAINVANTFMSNRQFEYAEKTYKEAEKVQNTSFDYEFGTLYYVQRDYKKMMTYYLKNLSNNPNQNTLATLQSQLQYLMSYSIDDEIEDVIETSILEKVQKEPSVAILSELLIWQYTQSGKYKLALNQIIAMDKRTSGEYESEIIKFAKTMSNNNQFDIAMEGLQYLINKGEKSKTYKTAYIGYIGVKFLKTTANLNPDKTELEKLETMFADAINMVLKKDSYEIIYSLAELKAFYLEKYDDAINLITKGFEDNIFVSQQEYEIKLLLGDIYFLNDNPWDATLMYAQVERLASERPIGHEARFRKARLAYYTGEFEWAQAQLDILKASTSKLIANDALELSLFITENYDLDTTATTMQIFARADYYSFSKQYEKAMLTLDTIISLYSSHTLIDDALYKKAQILENTNNLEAAAELYNKVFTTYHYDILADNALFRYAIIQEKLKNFQEAQDAYFKLISEYPGSIFTVEAREKLRNNHFGSISN